MSRADIAVMRRLVKKTNILPVIARADCLTDDALAAIKKVVKRDIEAAGLDLGVFNPVSEDRAETPRAPRANGKESAQEGEPHDDGAAPRGQDEETSEPEEERSSRPVIKLRASRSRFRMPWTRSRSRSRLEDAEPGDEPTSVDTMDTESVASVRFSARRVAQAQLGELVPFAFIAPEPSRRRLPPSLVPPLPDDHHSVHTDAGVSPSDDMHTSESAVSSPVSTSKHAPFLAGPPADLRGVFVRKYRWGTIDVLSPEHCDFAALRTAVLSTHMKVRTDLSPRRRPLFRFCSVFFSDPGHAQMLKIRTKEVLYERYRTEKLLTRRATKSISADQQRQMFDGGSHLPRRCLDPHLETQSSAFSSISAVLISVLNLFLIVVAGYPCCASVICFISCVPHAFSCFSPWFILSYRYSPLPTPGSCCFVPFAIIILRTRRNVHVHTHQLRSAHCFFLLAKSSICS